MTEIEHRVEVDAVLTNPDYSGREFSAEDIENGEHRQFIGGVWDSHGHRQLEFLTSHGMLPEHRLLDVGCGCFRAGRGFIDYLDPERYYGIDANHSLLVAGYDIELNDAQRAKLPPEHLRATDRFAADFGVEFDFAIANSVFSHVSLNHIRLCLYRLGPVMKPGGSFFATFFERKADFPLDKVTTTRKGKGYFTEKNLYWYYRRDLRWASTFGPWKFNYIGDWGHPANQKMIEFVKLTDDEVAERQAKAQQAKHAKLAGQARKAQQAKQPAPKPKPAPQPAPQPSVVADLRKHLGRGKRWARRTLKDLQSRQD